LKSQTSSLFSSGCPRQSAVVCGRYQYIEKQ